MKSRSRSLSADMGTQLLPPPTSIGVGSKPVAASRTSGSKVQRRAPVRASKPRMAPFTELELRNLLANAETATTPLIAVGGDASWVSSTPSAGNVALISVSTLTSPLTPKPAQRLPSRASIAMRRLSAVARNRRWAQAASGAAVSSAQYSTPRHLKRPA